MKLVGTKSINLQFSLPSSGVENADANPFNNRLDRDDLRKSKITEGDACYEGKVGLFSTISNDFTMVLGNDEAKMRQYFEDLPHWSPEKRAKVKKFRFVVASLVLFGLAFSLMSRMVLNVGIVGMVRPPETAQNTSLAGDDLTTTTTITTTVSLPTSDDSLRPEVEEDEYFDWTPKMKNYLIASFYMGYAPSMMLTGDLATKYGSWYPMFIALFSSFLMNAITPTIAHYSYELLFVSRILLGILQGCILPAAYDLFNRWLTFNEASIFVPMIKVSFAIGSLLGSAMTGITSSYGYKWPYFFYESSLLCAIWSLAWFMLATSSPQTNHWVESNELNKIMRKKIQSTPVDDDKKNFRNNSNQPVEQTPWLLIAFSPSILALAFTILTYNIGLDFLALELSIYLQNIHKVPIETISKIGSFGFLLQAIFITGIGYLARYVVVNKSFGLSKSKWRKIFQGASNFGMAFAYFSIALANPSYEIIICLLVVVYVAYMFGAGGESLVPYDLSTKYPATISGFTNAIGMISSVSLPAFCDIILQADDSDPDLWNMIFLIIGSACFLGGLAFTFILKPKPFLPGEVETKQNKLTIIT